MNGSLARVQEELQQGRIVYTYFLGSIETLVVPLVYFGVAVLRVYSNRERRRRVLNTDKRKNFSAQNLLRLLTM